MKKLIKIIALALFAFALPALQTGCTSRPSERVVQVQTLKIVGATAETAVGISRDLYRDGKITATQAREVIEFYNEKFQPAFRLAKDAVNSDLNSFASPEIINLGSQLSALVINLQK